MKDKEKKRAPLLFSLITEVQRLQIYLNKIICNNNKTYKKSINTIIIIKFKTKIKSKE